MDIRRPIALLSAGLILFLAVLVIARDRKRPMHRGFFAISVIVCLWCVTFYIAFPDYFDHKEAVRVMYMALAFFPAAAFHFFAEIAAGRVQRSRRFLQAAYAVSGCLAVLCLTPLFDRGWGRPIPGPAEYADIFRPLKFTVAGYMFLGFALCFQLLVRAFRIVRIPAERNRIKFFAFGLAVAVAGGATDFLRDFGIPCYALGILATVANVLIFAYAIQRGKLVDIRLVLQRGLLFFFAAALLSVLYIGIQTHFADEPKRMTEVTVGATAAWILLMPVFTGPLWSFIERLVFLDRVEARRVLGRMAAALSAAATEEEALRAGFEALSFLARGAKVTYRPLKAKPARDADDTAAIIAPTEEGEVHFRLAAAGDVLGVFHLAPEVRGRGYSISQMEDFEMVIREVRSALDRIRVYHLAAEKERRVALLRRYLSPEVVQKVLSAGGGVLAGEHRTITILMADLREFTSMSEKLSPEDVVEILNRYLTHVTGIVFKYGGTLDKYIGDAVVALFGSPYARGDEVQRALRAAEEIRAVVLKVASPALERAGAALAVGIGVTTGKAVCGNIGSRERLEYTAVGEAVLEAGALQERAAAGEILLCARTAREAEARAQLEYTGGNGAGASYRFRGWKGPKD